MMLLHVLTFSGADDHHPQQEQQDPPHSHLGCHHHYDRINKEPRVRRSLNTKHWAWWCLVVTRAHQVCCFAAYIKIYKIIDPVEL